MGLMEFTEEEKKQSACYLVKELKIGNDVVNVVGGFYSDYSIAIEIINKDTNEMLSIHVDERFLSKYIFQNQVVINPMLDGKYKTVIDMLTDIEISDINIGHTETFVLTLRIELFEKMIHFLETMKELKETQSRTLKIN